MQTITEQLTAGVAKEWNIQPSRFFMLLETIAPVDVELLSEDGRTTEKSIGVESGFREKSETTGDRISRVKITSAIDQAVKFGYSVRDADNRKVTSTVAVVDGSIERSKNEIAHFMFIVKGAVAAEYSHCQLWNPAANTKRLIVNAMAGYHLAGAKERVVFYKYNTALGSVDPTYGEINKNFGSAAASGAEARIHSAGAGVSGGILLLSWAADAELVEFKLQEPVVLNPGEGIMVRTALVNTAVHASFQYYSEEV